MNDKHLNLLSLFSQSIREVRKDLLLA